jgi:hypothetical protein
MSEQHKEDVLHHVLAIANRNTAGAYIPKQGIAKPVEQGENVLLESRLFENLLRPARRKRGEAQCGFWCGVADHERVTRRAGILHRHSVPGHTRDALSAPRK